jgi:hypothetical protein
MAKYSASPWLLAASVEGVVASGNFRHALLQDAIATAEWKIKKIPERRGRGKNAVTVEAIGAQEVNH